MNLNYCIWNKPTCFQNNLFHSVFFQQHWCVSAFSDRSPAFHGAIVQQAGAQTQRSSEIDWSLLEEPALYSFSGFQGETSTWAQKRPSASTVPQHTLSVGEYGPLIRVNVTKHTHTCNPHTHIVESAVNKECFQNFQSLILINQQNAVIERHTVANSKSTQYLVWPRPPFLLCFQNCINSSRYSVPCYNTNHLFLLFRGFNLLHVSCTNCAQFAQFKLIFNRDQICLFNL